MALCPSCGNSTMEVGGVCLHHMTVEGEDWPRVNRIMCDGLHRGAWGARVEVQGRDEITVLEPA